MKINYYPMCSRKTNHGDYQLPLFGPAFTASERSEKDLIMQTGKFLIEVLFEGLEKSTECLKYPRLINIDFLCRN